MKETDTRPMTLNLQYFAEGSGGEGGGEAGTPAGTEGEGAAKSHQGKYRNIQSARPGKEDGQEKSAMAPSGGKDAKAREAAPKYKNVQRAQKGNPAKTGEAANGETLSGDTLDAEFESMIRGKYRDAWQKRADAIVNRRFAQMKALKENNMALIPLMDRLASRYGTQKGDIQGLMSALNREGQRAALPAHTGEESNRLTSVSGKLREMNIMRSHQRDMQEQAQHQQRVNAIHQRWQAEIKQAKAIYPGFDFDLENRNPDFGRLISSGIPVRHAYEVLHRDEIVGGAMHYTAQKTRQKLAADILARGLRPAENGVTGQTAVMPGFSFARLSKAAKAEIERRALRGERVNPRDYMDYK